MGPSRTPPSMWRVTCDAQERQGRVWHGVDQAAHDGVAVDAQVGAAERDDAGFGGCPRKDCHPVRPQARAGDCPVGPILADGVDEYGRVVFAAEAGDLGGQGELDTGLAQLAFQGAGDGGEIDDSGAGGVQCRHASAFRLDLADLAGVDAAQARDAVGVGALFQVGQPGQFVFADRDDELAAAFDRDLVLLAVLVHELRAGHAQPGLERAGGVVNAGMDDAGVVAGLVLGHLGGLVDDQDLGVRVADQEFPGDGQAYDSGTDYGDVMASRLAR